MLIEIKSSKEAVSLNINEYYLLVDPVKMYFFKSLSIHKYYSSVTTSDLLLLLILLVLHSWCRAYIQGRIFKWVTVL
jgi:hypothetical protein